MANLAWIMKNFKSSTHDPRILSYSVEDALGDGLFGFVRCHGASIHGSSKCFSPVPWRQVWDQRIILMNRLCERYVRLGDRG